jgi:ABC-type multidrug transport system fused ATPase/permease subunit
MKVGLLKVFSNSTLILSPSDRRKFWILSASQSLLGLLDLAGVAILGAVGALSVRSIQSQTPGALVNVMLNVFQIKGESFQVQVSVLTLVAVFLLVARTVATLVLSRKILYFLSSRGAEASGILARKILALPLARMNGFTATELQYALGPGMSAITLGVLGAGTTVIADLSLLLILGLGVTFVNPVIAICSFVLFSLTGYSLYLNMHKRARRLGEQISQDSIGLNSRISQTLESFRDLHIRNIRYAQALEIERLKIRASALYAEQSLMPYLSKYVIESALILGAVVIAALEFATQDISRAVAGLFLFIAAGSRIAPALLRLQQSALVIQSNYGIADTTINLVRILDSSAQIQAPENFQDFLHEGFTGKVEFNNVTFRYSSNTEPVLDSLTFRIEEGQVVAFVGSSGAGKSTMLDVLLGLNIPDTGLVEVSGLPVAETISKWPGAIGYVPQEVMLIAGSLRENIAFAAPTEVIDEDAVRKAIKLAQLDDLVNSLSSGLETEIGPKGVRLSGGQRQRVGIARALYTSPKLLILDEATSSLDGLTESEISNAIHALEENVTVILVAHRLSTAQKADTIFFIDSGKILSTGSFDELRSKVKTFDEQARMLGI